MGFRGHGAGHGDMGFRGHGSIGSGLGRDGTPLRLDMGTRGGHGYMDTPELHRDTTT